MQYLLDTVTLVRHFTGEGKMGRKAARILDELEQNDDTLIVSVVSLMEIMYLAEKNRIGINLTETLDIIASSTKYTVIDLNPDILRVAAGIDFSELHDRLILATAKWLGIPVISSDSKFSSVPAIETIWN